MGAKRSWDLPLGCLVATFVLCRCGSAAFSPASDGGADVSVDAASEVIIVVHADAASVSDAAGEAGCNAPTTLECSGTCVDPTLPTNCGSCGNSCVGPEAGPGQAVCEPGGLCAVACEGDGGDGGPAEILCTGTCVSPDDVTHCGTCTNTCAAPPSGNGTPTCPAAQCVMTCVSGYHPAGAGCNTDCLANTDDPSVDPCVVTDGLGAFVSPTGNDTTGDGSKEHPFGSIGHAMDTSARVYACGTFTGEQLVVSGTTRDGTSVYGGFDCATWTYTAGTPTKLAPTASGFALQVNGLTKGVTFEDFEFDSVPATTAGASSQAVLVYASQNVTFRRCVMTAGSASMAGTSGTNGVPNWSGVALTGMSATGGIGGGTQTCTCGGTGGRGGNAGTDDGHGHVTQAGGTGDPGTVGTEGAGGSGAQQGLVGATAVVVPCSDGSTGSAGSPGTGGSGGNSLGTLSVTGWSNPAGSGIPGQIGGAAQGGGGGGGATYEPPAAASGGAAGGGCGGCGGAGAVSGGNPGGSSIALASVSSAVVVDSCTLTAGVGGAGGEGGDAVPGQSGGPPGSPSSPAGCNGGGGGTGGTGGAGGGGAGGHSIGIAYSGTAPTQVGTVTISVAPTAALGGAPGMGVSSAASQGAPGLNVATQSF